VSPAYGCPASQARAQLQEPERARQASAQLAAPQAVRWQQDLVVSAQQHLAKQRPERSVSVQQ
jgi:hypothetical protein